MERKIALVGYLQPIEGVASASLTTVDQYLNSNSPPSYAFKEYESINAKLKTMQPEKHSGKRGQIIKELIQSILKEATKQSLAGKAPSTPPFAPLALLSLHRQIFDTDGALVPGPIDQVFTIAPLETVEVRLEEVQRLTFEETKETTTSSNEDATVESRQSKELTDRFLDRVERSASANVSANASVTYGIFSGGVNASKTWSDAQSTSKEMVSVIASELAQRTSESISRTFSLRTRSTEEITRSNSYRKLIQNPTADVINYGLVKYYRTATIRSQLFRRYLCWRFTIENPGSLVALPGLITPQVVPNGATLSVGRPPQASIAGTDTRVSAVKLPNLGFRAKAAAPAKSTIEELAEFGVTQVQVSLRAIGNASLVDVVGVRRRIQVVRPATKGLPEMTWSANYKIANVIRPGSLSASSEVYFDFRL